MTNTTTLDRSIIDRKLEALIGRKQKEITFNALVEGGKELQKYTRESLLQKFPKAKTAKGKSKRSMWDEVHIIKDKQTNEVMVSVMNYLTKWYEMGTDTRYLKETHVKDETHHRTYKKGESRGRIKPLHYFREAREAHSDDVIQTIEDMILTALKKEFDNA